MKPLPFFFALKRAESPVNRVRFMGKEIPIPHRETPSESNTAAEERKSAGALRFQG